MVIRLDLEQARRIAVRAQLLGAERPVDLVGMVTGLTLLYALPVLHHDRLVGKVDAIADRRAGRLVVNAVHADVPSTSEITAGVDAELAALADWLGLKLVR